ncbi:hypothetical protein [Kocuria rhizophila]|uniref:hypothetical protein n=1 Tax=Kocuria rhizophila TaxID=72000 RepID=UPI003D6FBFE6
MAYDPQVTPGGSPFLGKQGTFPQFQAGLEWMARTHDALHDTLRKDFADADTEVRSQVVAAYRAADEAALATAKTYTDTKVASTSVTAGGPVSNVTLSDHPTLSGVAVEIPVVADTGWRKLPLLSNTTGNVFMRRAGTQVHMMFHAVSTSTAGNVTVATLPTGFKPEPVANANWRNGVVVDDAGTSARVTSYYGGTMRILSMESGKGYGGYINFITNEPWPSTLPGEVA